MHVLQDHRDMCWSLCWWRHWETTGISESDSVGLNGVADRFAAELLSVLESVLGGLSRSSNEKALLLGRSREPFFALLDFERLLELSRAKRSSSANSALLSGAGDSTLTDTGAGAAAGVAVLALLQH
jgi:hypothetical protein